LVIGDFNEEFLYRIRKLADLNMYGMPVEPVGYALEGVKKSEKGQKPLCF